MIDITQYNTYGCEWNNETITIYVNGEVCLTNNWDPAAPLQKPQPFDAPFFIALTQAIGTTGNEYIQGETTLPATTTVDYVLLLLRVLRPLPRSLAHPAFRNQASMTAMRRALQSLSESPLQSVS